MVNEIPYITDSEEVEDIYTVGDGAEITLLIGKTPNTKNLTKIYEFYSYQEAKKTVANGGVGPEPSGIDPANELLAAIKNIFEESEPNGSEFGAKKVYAINIGPTPTNQDWLDAQALGYNVDDVGIEEYVLNSTQAFIVTTAALLQTQASQTHRRKAIFTTATDESVATAIQRTDPDVEGHVTSSRIYIVYERTLQSKVTAKMAYTPYYEDPAYGSYRTVTASDLPIMTDPTTDYNTLISNGIICSMKSLQNNGVTRMAKPIKMVSTAYRSVDGPVPSDSRAHQRRIADHCFNRMDEIARAELQHLNMATGIPILTEFLKDFLEDEKKKGYIKDYSIGAQVASTDPFELDIMRSLTPSNTVEKINEKSTIKSP